MDTGRRPQEGWFPVLEFVLAIASSAFASGLFGYLRYRSYLKLVEHVVDRHGVDGLRLVKFIARPGFSRVEKDLPAPELPSSGSTDNTNAAA